MINLFFYKVKELEEFIEKIKKRDEKIKDELIELFKNCKIEKSKKEEFKEKLFKTIALLNIKYNHKFFRNNMLTFSAFEEAIKNEEGYLVIISTPNNEETRKFLLGFLIKKISPFFTISQNKIIGFLKELSELKNIKSIPFYNPLTEEFNEIELFTVIFQKDKFNVAKIEKAKKIFNELQRRPSLRNKHFIEYSLKANKIVDFEKEKANKEKEKYIYIFDESYPNLEIILKKEKENIPFVLALLEKIDMDLEKIKDSKGLENIVNRMLNFIERNIDDKLIKDEVNFLRRKLHH